ncbi:MAG: response regulator transcription factor [Shinella sp.]|nr:response regulator transcription factor [Shinella sp.]
MDEYGFYSWSEEVELRDSIQLQDIKNISELRRLQEQSHPKYAATDFLAIVDKRNLERECLATSLANHNVGLRLFTFSNLEDLKKSRSDAGALRAVLFNAGSADADNTALVEEIAELVSTLDPIPVVVLAHNQDLATILKFIGVGVRGYIPTSVGIEVCVQAIALAIAGGKFVPASSILAMRGLLGVQAIRQPRPGYSFTVRQSAVADALRRGKANKIIAHELDLCESTVKVHIRNIMKKLGATNRTEVACKIGELTFDQPRV